MSNIPGPKFSYCDLLDHATEQSSLKEQEDIKAGVVKHKVLRPSSSGKCSRELAYALLEQTGQMPYVEQEIRPPATTRLLSIGHAIEEHFIKQFKVHASEFMQVINEQQEVKGFNVISNKFPDLTTQVTGSLDWLFMTEDGKGIIDCKSKKNKFHAHFRDDWSATTDKLTSMKSVTPIAGSQQGFYAENLSEFIKELDDPFFESNFYQLNFYCNTDWAKAQGINHGAIIQYNKNDSQIREIRFKPCPNVYEETRKRFQAAVDAADKGDVTIAPKNYNYGSIKCAFCPYKKLCWKDESQDALQAYFDTNFHQKRWPEEIKKLNKDVAKELEECYSVVKEATNLAKDREKAEGVIVGFMLDNKLKKVKFKDDTVWELRYLKTAKPNYQLRRSKP